MVQKSKAESCKNRNTKFFVSNRLRETIIETSRRAGITEWPCQSVFLLERNALLYHFRTIAHKPLTFAFTLERMHTLDLAHKIAHSGYKDKQGVFSRETAPLCLRSSDVAAFTLCARGFLHMQGESGITTLGALRALTKPCARRC